MRGPLGRSTVGPVIKSAIGSFWAEPRVADPPGRVWWDWALVAVVAAAGTVEVALRDDLVWRPVVLLLCVAPALGLLWRRTRPLLVTAIVFGAHYLAAAVAWIGSGEPTELDTSLYVLLLPYALFRWGSGRQALMGMVPIVAVAVPYAFTQATAVEALAGLLVLLAPAQLGALVRYRAVSRLRGAEEMRLREREQLARELHDTVAHHVSAIAIQAQAGRVIAASRPKAAVEALEVIEEAASRTLDELRTIVGALREDGQAELTPQRGVADVRRLAQTAGEGPRVDVELAGDMASVQPLVGAAVYRIAQESITNAVRHARDATRIEVTVAADDRCVRLSVRDDGHAGPSGGEASGGYGLAGMAERATLLGGTFEAGPQPSGGWAVSAVLPRTAAGA